MHNDVADRLSAVSSTLLIPLVARARETFRSDRLFEDPEAVRLFEALRQPIGNTALDRITQLSIAIRTKLLDLEVANDLRLHSEAIVNLGAGLCTRFERLGRPGSDWIELDLPEVIALRRQLLDETASHRFIASSVLDFGWMDSIPAAAPLFIAEGLLMYLEESEVQSLLTTLADRFPGSRILLEVLSSTGGTWSLIQPWLRRSGARFRWTLTHTRDVERWGHGIHVEREWMYLDHYPERWGMLRALRVFPAARRAGRLLALRLGAENR